MMSVCFIFFIPVVVLSSSAATVPILDTILPRQLNNSTILDLDSVLTSVFLRSSGSNHCNICDAISRLTIEMTCKTARNCDEPTEKLVNFYCVKSRSSKVFQLDLTNPKANLLRQFDRNALFAFLIHGFTDYYPGQLLIDGTGWMERTIIDWAKNDINVCAVNWGQLSLESMNYFVVSQMSTARVADYLVQVLFCFEENGVDLSKTILAGHSLGAQIAGKIGAKLRKHNKTLGRIYGLDPAGPCYTFPCHIDRENRIDESDATFVQCIHTNIGVLGQMPRCGCQDFYLNLGIIQPGAITIVMAHYFAVSIFDWTLDKKNQCYSILGRQLIGIHSENKCGSYQLNTRSKAPYCGDDGKGLVSNVVHHII